MRRNRKITQHARMSSNTVWIVALIIAVFIAGMLYWSQDARCSALAQENGHYEREYNRLVGNCQREISSWEELKTPDKLRQAIARHGLDMDQANQNQVIHMNRHGAPAAGQLSVARARARHAQGSFVETRVGTQGRLVPQRTGQGVVKKSVRKRR